MEWTEGSMIEFVQIVSPLVDVVAHLFVRHRDRAAPAATSLNRSSSGLLSCAVVIRYRRLQVHHRPRDRQGER